MPGLTEMPDRLPGLPANGGPKQSSDCLAPTSDKHQASAGTPETITRAPVASARVPKTKARAPNASARLPPGFIEQAGVTRTPLIHHTLF
jgi:hypothetical protein